MASNGWKRTLHFLGLVEDYEDEYAEVAAGDPMGAPPQGAEPPAAPRPEPSNVRRIPTAGSMDEPAPMSSASGPASSPAPVQPSGTVKVMGAPGSETSSMAPKGPRTVDRVHVTSPTAFNDVEEIGERFRSQTPVLMNLQGASEPLAKRLLDFASGLIYGLDGSIERTGDKIFLLTPADVDVADAEMDRLRDRGLVS